MLNEPGNTLGQSIAQVPPFSISGNPKLTRVHWQVFPTLVERSKMLSQGVQAPEVDVFSGENIETPAEETPSEEDAQ